MMTIREKKERLELEAQLRTARAVAQTAIDSMDDASRIFGIMGGTAWMVAVDPDSNGPRAICICTHSHMTSLAQELRDKLELNEVSR